MPKTENFAKALLTNTYKVFCSHLDEPHTVLTSVGLQLMTGIITEDGLRNLNNTNKYFKAKYSPGRNLNQIYHDNDYKSQEAIMDFILFIERYLSDFVLENVLFQLITLELEKENDAFRNSSFCRSLLAYALTRGRQNATDDFSDMGYRLLAKVWQERKKYLTNPEDLDARKADFNLLIGMMVYNELRNNPFLDESLIPTLFRDDQFKKICTIENFNTSPTQNDVDPLERFKKQMTQMEVLSTEDKFYLFENILTTTQTFLEKDLTHDNIILCIDIYKNIYKIIHVDKFKAAQRVMQCFADMYSLSLTDPSLSSAKDQIITNARILSNKIALKYNSQRYNDTLNTILNNMQQSADTAKPNPRNSVAGKVKHFTLRSSNSFINLFNNNTDVVTMFEQIINSFQSTNGLLDTKLSNLTLKTSTYLLNVQLSLADKLQIIYKLLDFYYKKITENNDLYMNNADVTLNTCVLPFLSQLTETLHQETHDLASIMSHCSKILHFLASQETNNENVADDSSSKEQLCKTIKKLMTEVNLLAHTNEFDDIDWRKKLLDRFGIEPVIIPNNNFSLYN